MSINANKTFLQKFKLMNVKSYKISLQTNSKKILLKGPQQYNKIGVFRAYPLTEASV